MKKHYSWLLAIFALATFLLACSSDEESGGGGGTQTMDALVGDWFQEASTDNSQILGTSKYNADGTYEAWYANVDPETNYYFTYSGKYTCDEKSITVNYVSPFTNNPLKVQHAIRSQTKYDLVTFDPVNSTVGEQHRIIATYNLSVGQSATFQNEDTEFKAASFTTTAKRIATVDARGNIKAVGRGMAFICAKSSIGTAVVRVIVTDPNNVIDDYLQFMGMPVENTIATYGNSYQKLQLDDGMEGLFFNVIDDMVETVVFAYGADKKVNIIIVTPREEADLTLVSSSFDKKYETLLKQNSQFYYGTEKDGRGITILLNPTTIIYVFDADPYSEYDDLVSLSLEQIASRLDYTLTAEDWTNGYFIQSVDNQVFEFVMVMFDTATHKVLQVSLFCYDNMQMEEVEEWYKEHYFATDIDAHTYGQQEVWATGDYIIQVEEDETLHYVSVSYIKL